MIMESLWVMNHLGICTKEINKQDKKPLKNFRILSRILKKKKKTVIFFSVEKQSSPVTN